MGREEKRKEPRREPVLATVTGESNENERGEHRRQNTAAWRMANGREGKPQMTALSRQFPVFFGFRFCRHIVRPLLRNRVLENIRYPPSRLSTLDFWELVSWSTSTLEIAWVLPAGSSIGVLLKGEPPLPLSASRPRPSTVFRSAQHSAQQSQMSQRGRITKARGERARHLTSDN